MLLSLLAPSKCDVLYKSCCGKGENLRQKGEWEAKERGKGEKDGKKKKYEKFYGISHISSFISKPFAPFCFRAAAVV